jgi:large subunit ribosomal protein L9
MKVILNTDIPNLGEEGDILNVSPGYARNYLLPKGLVSMYNKTNLSILEGRKKAIEKRREEKRLNAQSLKQRISSGEVEFTMPAGDNGKLFGAVTAQMVVEELEKQGMTVERKKVDIPGHTLKALGNYKIRIRLYGDEEAELNVKIVREGAAPESPKAPATPAAPAAPAEVVPPVEETETAVVEEAVVEEAVVEEAVVEEPVAEEAVAEEAEEAADSGENDED